MIYVGNLETSKNYEGYYEVSNLGRVKRMV